MNRKVYFAGSIRGGRNDAGLYHEIIACINETDRVLTEMVGDVNHNVIELGQTKDRAIYTRDTEFLKECDMVIAECTTPSLGVGYELAYAEKLQKPVHIFYRPDEVQLSAMLTGDPYFMIHRYSTKEEILSMVKDLLK